MEFKCNIHQLDPGNVPLLCQEYANFKNLCPNYDYINLNDFLKCRNSIYILSDDDSLLGPNYHHMLGIIGIKLSTMDDIGAKYLNFYCKPDCKLYEIAFLHYTYIYSKINMLNEYISNTECLHKLIEEALADKNDGFTAYKTICPTGKTTDMHDALYESNFRIQNYNPVNNEYLYIRTPKMNIDNVK